MADILSAEELARYQKCITTFEGLLVPFTSVGGYHIFNEHDLRFLLAHIAALESDLAASEAARGRAEATLKVIELGAVDALEKTDIARRYFAHTEELNR